MNHMKQIAEMVGVELDEEFKIAETTYKITENGVKIFGTFGWTSMGSAFFEMLAGNFEITRLPWKPKEGENFYFCRYNPSTDNYIVCGTMFSYEHNKIYIKTGNYFRTQEEAEANLEAYKEWLEGESLTDWRDR